ncbi:MAG TPA: COX15/CtaA family protein, partial [Gemmatimonadaceae bacterium]|nr:COX15/CtaA family protein [Gemmatimonadaceae bacterium]
MTTTRRLAYLALFLAYAQIVFGAVVRITDSGMGCGDHWPKCNGLWFPPLDNTELIIEITHRWIAAGLLIATVALVVAAYLRRHEPRIGGRGGVLRAASLAAALWLAPAILGAITVWLELPPLVVVIHLALAMALLAVLAVTVMRAGGLGATVAERGGVAPRAARAAIAAAVVTFVVVILGGFTANVPGAAPACQGFPLCNGRVLTDDSAQTIHWVHRVMAFLLTLHVLGMVMGARKRGDGIMLRAAALLLGVIVVQLTVAAVLVSTHLPPALQSLHQAVGTLVWLSAVVGAGLGARGARGAQRARGENLATSITSPSSTSSTS